MPFRLFIKQNIKNEKTMKKLLSLKLFMILAALTFMTACNDDDNPGNTWTGTTIGNLVKVDDATYYIDTFKGNKLYVSNYSDLVNNKIEAGSRVYCAFLIESENPKGSTYQYNIRVYQCIPLTVKEPIHLTPENAEEVGNDRINLLYAWSGDKYIDIQFQIQATGNITHTVNLVTVDEPEQEKEGYKYLELRHNANSDYALENYNGMMSFDITKILAEEPNLKGFLIKVPYQNGVKYVEVAYESAKADIEPITSQLTCLQ